MAGCKKYLDGEMGMTEERPVQAQECYEHHMLLKGQLNRINKFLFGDPDHPDDLSVTAKVNLMFNVLLEIKRWAIGAVFTFAGCLIFLGSHFAKIDNIAEKLDSHIRQTDIAIESIEKRVVTLEDFVYKRSRQ